MVHADGEEARRTLASARALPEDDAHAARRRNPERSAAALTRRRLLRALAARLLRVEPDDIAFDRDSGVAPRIVAPQPLYVSAASRDGWTLLGVGRDPIGVDVERIEAGAYRPLDLLHPRLADRLAKASDAAFVRAWCAAEAYLKLAGIDLEGLDKVSIDGNRGAAPGAEHSPGEIAWRQIGSLVFAVATAPLKRGPLLV